MRQPSSPSLASFALSTLLLAACAHTREEVHTTTIEPTLVAEPETPAVERAPESRPRLSKTVTLGQGTEWQYTPSAAVPSQQASAAPAQTVVVNNNNIVVQGGAPGYYAPGYYGYGARGYGRPTTFYSGDGRSGSRVWGGSSAWGSSGWEGARRTAAPGQTPGVGGNWSPPPSFGPAPMR